MRASPRSIIPAPPGAQSRLVHRERHAAALRFAATSYSHLDAKNLLSGIVKSVRMASSGRRKV
ncbi:hypothetical protein PUN4_820003 [Paraburkholderia unamae]|nr:hypothetical protein PUN4_820003 [Paraburkholderia unamae]